MSKLPPLVPHFTPEGSPLNKTYEKLLRDAARKDALDDRTEQQRLKSSPGKKDNNKNNNNTTTVTPIQESSISSPNLRKKRRETPEFDGSHVQTQEFASDLLERVGLNNDPVERELLSTAASTLESLSTSLPSSPFNKSRNSSSQHGSQYGTPSQTGGLVSSGEHSNVVDEGRDKFDVGASPTMLRRNVSLVQVLNDVQQVTLCFQEIIKHISFHRVNTGRVLWKLQATYVQLFERLIQVFSQRAKQKAEEIKESGGTKNEELDMLRLQVMDKQAKLDAAEKTKHAYMDTIKEQNANIGVLQKEIDTLRAAIVEEASAADEAIKRRSQDEEEIRHKVQLDLKKRQDARKALFGGHEPSELDKAFTNSLGTMFDAIEDADVESQEQEKLLVDMNSLMDVQQLDPFYLASAAFRKLRSRENKRHLLNENFDEIESKNGISKWGSSLSSEGLSSKYSNRERNEKMNKIRKKHKKREKKKAKDTNTFSSSKKKSTFSILDVSSDDSDDEFEKMLQERERKAAETREQELKKKFEKERAELANERASMIKQLNKMREDVEQQQAALKQQQEEIQEQADQHQSRARKLERDAKKQEAENNKKLSNAQQLMNSVSSMGARGPSSDAMTQTAVDEECLWDTNGAHEVAISGAVLEQIWNDRKIAADKYYGKNVVTRKIDPLANVDDEIGMQNSMRNTNSDESGGDGDSSVPSKRGKGGWLIPPSLRHFMSNLPKTVEAQPIKTLKWLSKTIDEIYQQKLVADYYDNRDGDPMQSLKEFLCEYLLMKYGLRRVAEMHLYEIIMSIKKYFSKNPKVLMFARFMGLVKIKGKVGSGIHIDRQQDTPELDIGVLQVFLYTRRRLLLSSEALAREINTPGSIPPATASSTIETKDDGPPSNDTEQKGGDKKKKKMSHVVYTSNVRTYIPLGHAITEMRKVTSFMAPRKLIKFMRTIERGVAMRRFDENNRVYPVSNDTGGQTAVRFVMRNSMLGNTDAQNPGESRPTTSKSIASNESGGGDGDGGGGGGGAVGENDDIWHVCCCLDTSLEVLLDILELRSKQVYEELVRAFVEGDDNGDGVLSFDEFEAIIQNKKPEFSSRRALRMFKIALEGGGGNSTAIERPAFVRTCKQFGLGKLVEVV